VACRNAQLAKLRTHKREELLAATEHNLAKIKARVDTGKLAGADEIGLRVGKVINQYKVAKHFELVIGDNAFSFAQTRQHRQRSRARRHLPHPHFSERGTDGRAPVRAQLQGARQRGARVPLTEDDRSEGAPDSPSHCRPGARASSCACLPITSSDIYARPGAS
jgi:hypothetical protein